MSVRAVIFDVGGTLIDETRQWRGWARWLGVPEADFFAVLGAVIEQGAPTKRVFEYFGHGDIDPLEVRRSRMAAGEPDEFGPEDVYPDVRSTLEELRGSGLFVGVAGNQPRHRQEVLERLALPADLVATSAVLGAEKPAREFFDRVVAAAGFERHEVAYVGDRMDHDVIAAEQSGLVGIHIRRGPWGHVLAPPGEDAAAFRVQTLSELPDLLHVLKRKAAGAGLRT